MAEWFSVGAWLISPAAPVAPKMKATVGDNSATNSASDLQREQMPNSTIGQGAAPATANRLASFATTTGTEATSPSMS
jgi:hypothetical protein